MRRTTMAKTAKTAVSLGLLAAIVAQIGPRVLVEQLGWMNSSLVAVAFALLLAESLVRTLNWFQLTHGAGCAVPLRAVAYAYYVGGFFGALLPSTVGTDVARSAVAAQRSSARVETLLAATALLNVLSLAVIGATGLAACAWLLATTDTHAPRAVLAAAVLGSGTCLVGVLALMAAASSARAAPAMPTPDARPATGLRARVRQRITRFRAALAMWPRRSALASATLVAVSSYALRSLGWLTLLWAAGAHVPWSVLLTLGPLVTLGAALPISVLGFGGFQAISVFVLAQWGVPPSQALAASLVQSGLALLLYGIGCGVYLAGGRASNAPLSATGGTS